MGGVRSHRSRALFTVDLTRHLHIPVTTPERTIVDLSASVPIAVLGRIVDDGLRRRLVRLDRLRSCVGRLGKSPGRRPAALHELLAARLPGYDPGDSDLETRALRALVGAGLPAPVQQHRVRIMGRTIRIDLAYVGVKLAIELDGWESTARAPRSTTTGRGTMRSSPVAGRSCASPHVRPTSRSWPACGPRWPRVGTSVPNSAAKYPHWARAA